MVSSSVSGMSQLAAPLRHPVLACVEGLEDLLDQVTGLDPVFLATGEKAEVLVRLSRVVDRVEALRLRVMAAAMDVADVEGAPTVAAWLAPRTNATTRSLHAREALARGLDRRWQHVGEALGAGRVTLAQAEVIVRALEALDSPVVGQRLDPGLLEAAQRHLVERAADFTPPALRALGERILEVVCPEEYDDQERRALLVAERRASAATRLTLHVRGDGSVDVRARIPEATAARLQTYLEAFTAPRRSTAQHAAASGAAASGAAAARDEAWPDPDAGEADDIDGVEGRRVPGDQRRGQAFCALLEAIDPTQLPRHGGVATTVVVTIPVADLITGLGTATLNEGTRISAGEARRLACTAALLPAVVDGESAVLDLGRTRRLFTPAQRKAMAVSQRTCRATDCTVPATWCEAHHSGDPWSRGGRTDLADGVLLCSWHHHRAHDDRYLVQRTPNGAYRFHQRT